VLWDGAYTGLNWVTTPLALARTSAHLHRHVRDLRVRTAIADAFCRSLLPAVRRLPLPARIASHCARPASGRADAAAALTGARLLGADAGADADTPLGAGERLGGSRKQASESWVSACPAAVSASRLAPGGFPLHAPPAPTAQLMPFSVMQPRAAGGAALPASSSDPLAFVPPTFPAELPHDAAVLRALGCRGFQLELGRAAKRLPWADAAAAAMYEGAGVYPYAETCGHVPLALRPREPTADERVAALSGKKKEQREKTNEFLEWMKNQYRQEQ
jgi:hypothetical protein